MKEFSQIYLSWRKGQGSRRHIVGLLQEKKQQNGYVFSYIKTNVEAATKEGFSGYTEFPNIDAIYNGNTVDIFAQRLTKSDRPDIQSFYDFWEIEPQRTTDKFYLLGHTQGLVPTDNFEFLADYEPVDSLHFLTDIAGLSSIKLPIDAIKVGDELTFELEPQNNYDSEAVRVLKGDLIVGYIKKIHCRVFHKKGSEKLRLVVKAIERNGYIKRAFIKVSF